MRWAALLTAVFCGLPALATTFTSDTTIGVTNTLFDGADIVVTNASLTIDGQHAFASLSVLKGAVLTHTAVPTGFFAFAQTITNEMHVISRTNPAVLNFSNVVDSSITVWDQTGTMLYSPDFSAAGPPDYGVGLYGGTDIGEIQLTSYSRIQDGSTILVNYSTLYTVPSGLNLSIAGPVLVAPGGAINVNGRGYGPGMGLGPGHSSSTSPFDGSGGGHLGYGGLSSSNAPGGACYSAGMEPELQPANKGSGGGAGVGGSGGWGGGVISITAGETMELDGVISADGFNATNSRSGGGAGGAILLAAPTIAGSGHISANGGMGEPNHGGGGGGGLVGLYFGSNWFTGSLIATGGMGFVKGGAGVVYTYNTNQPVGQVVIDNGGGAGTNTPVYRHGDVIIRGGARGEINDETLSSLLVASNSFLVGPPQANAFPYVLVTVTGNATIQSGGGFLSFGFGTFSTGAVGNTTNNGTVYAGSGGGNGGEGGASGLGTPGGASVGSVIYPVLPGGRGGSGSPPGAPGAGGLGGGGIELTVNGTLDVDGTISANGAPGVSLNSGGGAGGSVELIVSNLVGSGSVTANGGAGNHLGGGGGGGRISIICQGTNLFSGTMTAHGGLGASPGGAGTIFTQIPNPGAPPRPDRIERHSCGQ